MIKKSPKEENTRSSSGQSQQISYDLQKQRKFYIKESIYALYFVFRIVLTVVVLVVINQNFIQRLHSTDSYQRMQQNILLWKLDVIVNITTVNSYNCPEGYQTYTGYNWPGTKEGCYCYAQLAGWDYSKILEGSCSHFAMDAGCVRVDKIDPIPFLFWKKDQLICIKRVKNLNFFTNLQALQISYSKCLDGLSSRFDIPSSMGLSLCPITDIQNDSTLPNLLDQIKFSFNRQSNYPIVQLRMTEYQFCPDFTRQNISPFKQRARNYNLQNILKQPCLQIDKRVQIIDQIGEDQLFQSNPSNFQQIIKGIKDAVSILPAYPQPSAIYRYKLGFIRYPQWTYACRKSEKFNLNQADIHLNLQKISSYAILCIGLSTVFAIFFGLLFTVFYTFRKCQQIYHKSQQQVLYDTLPELQRKKPNLYEKLNKAFLTQLIIYVLKLATGLSLIIILAVLFLEVQQYFLWYKDARTCTSEIMKQWIQLEYVTHFQSQLKNILLCIVIVISLLVVDLMMFCWRSYRGDFKNEQKEQDQPTDIFGEEEARQKQVDYRTNDSQEMNQKHDQFDQQKHGKIRKNHGNNHQILVTQDDLIDRQSIPQSTIIRPKRPIKRKRMLSSEISDNAQQWDI